MIKTGLFSARSHRGGYTLVFFAMLMFALMGLAALVIDIGFARLAQRQMQTAVDSAALEGLRFRDDPIVPEDKRDSTRRQRASDLVSMIFDDDLDPGNGDDGAFYDAANLDPHEGEQFNVEGQFGAGPVLKFTDGAGSDPDLAASEFINDPTNPNPNPRIGSYPATPVYKPTRGDGTRGLEFNNGDAIHGDMVSGRYLVDEDHYDENRNYVRSDFPTSMPDDSAFLVRMRRSNNFDGLDKQDAVSTHGPTVPYLFGRGSLLAVRDPEMVSDYLPRRHGMTVRATGIADARSVLSVGMPDESATPPLKGLARFALFLSEWNDLPAGTAVLRDLSNGGVISAMGQTTGLFFDFGPISSLPVVIGRTLPAPSVPLAGEYTGYVPIYDEIPGGGTGVNRVVGFGLATAVVAPSGTELVITRGTQQMLVENVSAVVCHAVTLIDDEWVAVFERNKEMYDVVAHDVSGTLLAPVSVR